MAEEKEVKGKLDSSLKDVFDGYAKIAKESKKDTLVNIDGIYLIRFNQDHLGHEKGSIANVSKVASDLYILRGVASLVKE